MTVLSQRRFKTTSLIWALFRRLRGRWVATGSFQPNVSFMKVTIVGPGKVGGVLAYTLMLRQVANEIVLVGRDREKTEGEALDLEHAQVLLDMPVKIVAGNMEAAAGSQVVVICASVPSPTDIRDRNFLAKGNAKLMRDLLPQVAAHAPDCKLVMLSNPVDALTWLAIELTQFPPERVIGTGTLLDSMRFRNALSTSLSIHPGDLRAYVLGEHGEHQFAAMSVAESGGERIEDTPERRILAELTKKIGPEIVQKKGNTCYAIAQAAAYLVESILLDECRTMPLSVKVEGYLGVKDVCLSLPVVIGRAGVLRRLYPPLDDHEADQFRAAAAAVRRVIDSISL